MKNLNKFLSKTVFQLIFIVSVLMLSVSGCAKASDSKCISESDMFFDTIVTISIYDQNDTDAHDIIDKCFEKCRAYEELFDAQSTTGDIYRINSSEGFSTQVNPETIELLEAASKYGMLSEGLFDVSICPVSQLWDFHGSTNTIPDEKSIADSLLNVDYSSVVYDKENGTVTLRNPKTSIDIGGIAKGYIADKLAEYLSESGVDKAIINIGGDMQILGKKSESDDFTIGITDPFGNGPAILGLSISDKAVATSGTYERAFECDGKKYHHILDPRTGYPVDTDIVSATVIAEKSIDADTLCTIMILEGSEKGLSVINSLPNTEAILIGNDGTIYKSLGADVYIKN